MRKGSGLVFTPVQVVAISNTSSAATTYCWQFVRSAIPYGVGDTYMNHRIVATLPKAFGTSDDASTIDPEKAMEYRLNQHLKIAREIVRSEEIPGGDRRGYPAANEARDRQQVPNHARHAAAESVAGRSR